MRGGTGAAYLYVRSVEAEQGGTALSLRPVRPTAAVSVGLAVLGLLRQIASLGMDQPSSGDGVSGKYFVKQKAVPSSQASCDQAAAARLWQVSAELTRLPIERRPTLDKSRWSPLHSVQGKF